MASKEGRQDTAGNRIAQMRLKIAERKYRRDENARIEKAMFNEVTQVWNRLGN